MQGIELSQAYFESFGAPMLKAEFPELWPRLAAGVCGQGSENFGFDDETSRDHDFDPGFYIFLMPEDYKEYEFRLSRAYDRLPREFMGVKLQGESVYGTARHGVKETPAFFRSLTGFYPAPETNALWLTVPQHRLACAVNGRIFYDGPGFVTAARAALSAMPEDARKKKLAKHLALAAQAGQYNYARALAHGQPGSAALALARFAEEYAKAAFLLNRQYAPFYKWLLPAGKKLPLLGKEIASLQALLASPLNETAAPEIERLAAAMIRVLRQQNLSDFPSEFLEPHANEVMRRIEDPALRNLHVME